MRIYKAKDYNDLSRKAANIISAQVILKPDCVLGLATGSTPIGTYKQLIEWYNRGDLDFSETKSVNLDEYRGLTKDNDQSYTISCTTTFSSTSTSIWTTPMFRTELSRTARRNVPAMRK